MDTLDRHLPYEIVDYICKIVHKKRLDRVHEELLHGVLWIFDDNKVIFWIKKYENPYLLLADDSIWYDVCKRKVTKKFILF